METFRQETHWGGLDLAISFEEKRTGKENEIEPCGKPTRFRLAVRSHHPTVLCRASSAISMTAQPSVPLRTKWAI